MIFVSNRGNYLFVLCVIAMARGRGNENDNRQYRCVKLALGSIIRAEYRLPLITIISEMSITATCIALLASLLFLFKVIEIEDYFLFFVFFL